MTARLRPTPLVPGTIEHATTLTASKMPAVLRLNPPGWGNRFSLWHEMAGLVPPDGDNDQKRRGHYLEPAIARWFADRHPDWRITRTGTWVNVERPWQASNPDRLISRTGGRRRILELKSQAADEEWGTEGTDEIPVHYRAQIMWQLDTQDLRIAHIAMITTRLEFREYRLDWNETEALWLREQALAFLDTLPGGANEQRPDIDGDTDTYETLRKLHPDIDGTDLDIPADTGLIYLDACRALDKAKAAQREAASEVLDAMGTARRAYADGVHVATRIPGRGDNPPYLKKGTEKKKTSTDRTAA
ncbi:YqaJ viral recombinase family protein [Rhodococcus aetherivorans]|uniref:YqaJ viral recombinase family protein n=1 Tax=Rhodococcus aetherivorans TaxID=191292 RepID=UPI0031E37890